ncbi:MAG: radical SAM protein [Deltaproteobacteria bacterium]|nr:radical SAM protein [Deltaproteobacteria bacterium]
MLIPTRPVRAAARALRAAAVPTTPLLAQLVVTRRCNLACGYCNEYDAVSSPVPYEELARRVDHLASLGTVVVTLTGGEPLLHPRLDDLVRRVVSHGMVATTITNGYPLTRKWIERLNAAGLTLIQISIDNLTPNDVSQKSLDKLRPRLELLREHARFAVNVNAVLGSSPPEDTRRLADEVEALGFYMTVGLMHDGDGQLDAGLAGDALAALYREMRGRSRKSLFHKVGEGWEDQMLRDGTAPWKCRAGARYLYVDERGEVSWCSQRRGQLGVDLLDYGAAELRRAFDTPKGCEAACTIACVRRASALDGWRPQRGAPAVPVLGPIDAVSAPPAGAVDVVARPVPAP